MAALQGSGDWGRKKVGRLSGFRGLRRRRRVEEGGGEGGGRPRPWQQGPGVPAAWNRWVHSKVRHLPSSCAAGAARGGRGGASPSRPTTNPSRHSAEGSLVTPTNCCTCSESTQVSTCASSGSSAWTEGARRTALWREVKCDVKVKGGGARPTLAGNGISEAVSTSPHFSEEWLGFVTWNLSPHGVEY